MCAQMAHTSSEDRTYDKNNVCAALVTFQLGITTSDMLRNLTTNERLNANRYPYMRTRPPRDDVGAITRDRTSPPRDEVGAIWTSLPLDGVGAIDHRPTAGAFRSPFDRGPSPLPHSIPLGIQPRVG